MKVHLVHENENQRNRQFFLNTDEHIAPMVKCPDDKVVKVEFKT